MEHHRQLKRGLRTALVVTLLCGVSAACSPNIENHGHIPDPDTMKKIHVGKTSRAEVRDLLGSPSTVAPFNKDMWFYIGDRTSQIAFLDPKVLKREVVIISFNKKGVVDQIQTLHKKDGREVQLVQRTTPTRGRHLTLLEQLIGNVGRFSGGNESDNGTSLPGGS